MTRVEPRDQAAELESLKAEVGRALALIGADTMAQQYGIMGAVELLYEALRCGPGSILSSAKRTRADLEKAERAIAACHRALDKAGVKGKKLHVDCRVASWIDDLELEAGTREGQALWGAIRELKREHLNATMAHRALQVREAELLRTTCEQARIIAKLRAHLAEPDSPERPILDHVRFAKLRHGAQVPQRATPGSAAFDLTACLEQPRVLRRGERMLVPTGLQIQLPDGHEAQVRPRSGLALRLGITVLNSPGTIDADYCGEIGVLLVNLGSEPVTLRHGDRVAQLVVAPVTMAEPVEVSAIDPSTTSRGAGGFGSTGVRSEARSVKKVVDRGSPSASCGE